MKFLLLLLLAVWSTVSNGQDFGSYHYQYNTGNMTRNEVRFLNGTVRGTYEYIDETDNLKHKVEYLAGSDHGFKIISHDIYDKNEIRSLSNNFTPEVKAARESHLAFQAALRASLPELKEEEEELPPVYIRHVPGPMQKEPIVPILEAMPLKIRNLQKTAEEVERSFPRKVVHVDNLPAHAQLGSRSYITKNLPANEIQPPTFRPITSSRPTPTVNPNRIRTKEAKIIPNEPQPLASDIQLVDGFTAEVAEATKQHLARVSAIQAVLPKLEEATRRK